MHRSRVLAIQRAWDDYEMGYSTWDAAAAIEQEMVADQRHEREQLKGMTVIVACARCQVPIEVAELAYRGPRRHRCRACVSSVTAGWPVFTEEEVPA